MLPTTTPPTTPPRSAKSGLSNMKIGWKYSSINAALCGVLLLVLVMILLLYMSVLMSLALSRNIIVQDAPNFISNMQQSRSKNFSLPNANEPIGKGLENNATSRSSSDSGKAKFTIFVGVFTMASSIERRAILRLAYAQQSSDDADITVRFVVGKVGSEFNDDKDVKTYQTLVGLENALYGDLMILACNENLNSGKTYSFFSSVPSLGVQYDYVMKLDDDAYIRFENLASALKPLSRTDLYFGYVLPCEMLNAYDNYMGGEGYVISWDLVEFIRESPVVRNETVGHEDKLTAKWFHDAGKAKNRATKKPQMYDHFEFDGSCARNFTLDTVLVHQLKSNKRWADALSYFEGDKVADGLSGSLAPPPST